MLKHSFPILSTFAFLLALFFTCSSGEDPSLGKRKEARSGQADTNQRIRTGAERMEEYLPLIEGERIAVLGNPTSRVGSEHLVDTLLARGVELVRILSPEHGFRGSAEAGEMVEDGLDPETDLPVVSLYGDHKKPRPEDLDSIDRILFDLQDVGARFYTYISTLHYVMEAAAEEGLPVTVLDRPNPNGFYVDGPILDTTFRSFIGMHPVPIVHGMTVGEYARMINGEGWLKKGLRCSLNVVLCANYDHSDRYELPVPPSPNLSEMSAVYLYPSLCLFEGTEVSVGRGTERPFTMIGHPDFEAGDHSFVPRSIPGKSKDPKHKGDTCRGFDLRETGLTRMKEEGGICLAWLIRFYEHLKERSEERFAFFLHHRFDRLAGTDSLRIKIEEGWSEGAIKESWEEELEAFRKMREKYLLYPE